MRLVSRLTILVIAPILVGACEGPTDCCLIPGSFAVVEAEVTDADGVPLDRASIRPLTYRTPCEGNDREYPQLHPPDSTDAHGRVELGLWVDMEEGVHCVDLVVTPPVRGRVDTISLDVPYFQDEPPDTARITAAISS